MSPSDADAVFAVMRSADPDVMDRDELAELTRRLAAHQAWCDALKVRVTRRHRQLASEGRAEPPHDLLSRHGRDSSKRGKAAAEREQVCTAMPAFEDALGSGAVSAGHLDAIANATRNPDEQLLADVLPSISSHSKREIDMIKLTYCLRRTHLVHIRRPC